MPGGAAAVAVAVSPANSGEEQVLSSNSSPIPSAAQNSNNMVQRSASCTSEPELLEENERLRKHNTQLSQEVSQLKGLCENILALMNNYASSSSSSAFPQGKPLELLPNVTPEEEVVPKLFGVSIGVKRCRKEGQETERDELQNQTGSSDVKSEPLDDRGPWLELGKQ